MKTNEQAVANAEEKLARLKDEYISYLTPIAIKVNSEKYEPSIEEFLRCQQLGNRFFNYLETFVGTSDLLGAHASGLWITGFAETCNSVLNAYITHINFLRSYKDIVGGKTIEPERLAFANMQRIVRRYLDAECYEKTRALYIENDLPVTGFTVDAHENTNKTPKWQIITSLGVGLVCVVSILVLAVIIPEPTEWQGFVFRGCFALGLAAVAVIVPGFLNVNAQVRGAGNYFKVVAGGAIAIFIVIWLVNPPSINGSTSGSDTVNKSLQRNAEASVE